MLSKEVPKLKGSSGRFCFFLLTKCCAGVRTGRAWMSHGPWHGASILRADHHKAAGQAFENRGVDSG